LRQIATAPIACKELKQIIEDANHELNKINFTLEEKEQLIESINLFSPEYALFNSKFSCLNKRLVELMADIGYEEIGEKDNSFFSRAMYLHDNKVLDKLTFAKCKYLANLKTHLLPNSTKIDDHIEAIDEVIAILKK